MFINTQLTQNFITLTISRPERLNALGTTLGDALIQSFESISKLTESSPRPLGVIITAKPVITKTAKKIAIAGGDISELAQLSPKEAEAYTASLLKVRQWIESCELPVIFFADGMVIGGGVEIFASADFRYCTQDTCFLFKHLNMGLPIGYGTTRRLAGIFGIGHLENLLYHARQIDSGEALRYGFVHKVFKADACIDDIRDELTPLLKKLSPEAFCQQKKMLLQISASRTYPDLNLFRQAWKNPHHQRQLDSFTRKKK